MYQSNSYGDNVNIFKPNFYSTFNKEEYDFKEKATSVFSKNSINYHFSQTKIGIDCK
jgi:hypothetical protein